ncbi:Appr-1-p processing protein [Actinoplanes sp. NPDC051470]|uniref:Appr-1-p processing protein n=1 Tax=unclassified Actinoplanes TaxID=2626549 RepID=UPI00341E7736
MLAVSRRWPEPERAFRRWHHDRSRNDFGLGATQVIQVQPDVWVANMVGQHGLKAGSAGPPVRYDAIEKCLHTVAAEAARLGASVHLPRVGCGLSGGRWDRVEPLIVAALCQRDIPVTVYDFD